MKIWNVCLRGDRMKIVATTTQSGNGIDSSFQQFLNESDIEYVPRQRKSLERIQRENQAQGVIVWERSGPVLYWPGSKFFFHPSMAKVRIALYRKKGQVDPLIEVCDLKEDDRFLDCTLGLGADAIVASYFTPLGQVVGLESSLPISQVVKWGMQLYQSEMLWLQEAIKRIKVINCEHQSYLKQLEDKSYDVVYFDPMFRDPLLKSQALSPLRKVANHQPLELETIQQACRVARKRVVIKERRDGSEFSRLHCQEVIGSPNNKIAFGVIHL
jgi:16S rRNA (guanine1516-N2)-methyltransferase